MKESAVRVHLRCPECGEEQTVLDDIENHNESPLGAFHCGVQSELRGVTTLYELTDEEEAGDGKEREEAAT